MHGGIRNFSVILFGIFMRIEIGVPADCGRAENFSVIWELFV